MRTNEPNPQALLQEARKIARPTSKFLLPLLLALATTSACAVDSTKPELPFVNPYLAASNYSVTHMRANFTPVAGPVGPGRRLLANEIQWKPIGPMNGVPPLYSAPYPNGKRVMWIGGYDRVAKLDADTLETLTTYAIGGNTYFGDDEIRRYVATMDRLDDKAFVDYSMRISAEPFRSSVETGYRLLSRENEFYLSYRAPDGSKSLRVYGEADAADPTSKILLRREWKFPPEIAKTPIMGMAMTADGWLVLVTNDGMMVVLSRDFATHHFLKLPSQREEAANQDYFSAFMRNNITVDDRGGIYVVTRDRMHRAQWTGKGLSMDEADGAWSAPYPNESGLGSGTTPGLMGWGPQEDHLVVITDGSRSNNMMAFWRDAIPADWRGLPGFDRRVAGVVPVEFGVSGAEPVKIENTPIIYGYGVFFDNSYPIKHLPDQGSPTKQWLTETLYKHVPGHEALGGTLIRWDPRDRMLKTGWQSQLNFVGSVCTVSGATDILYCWGARNREWTLEGVDWKTGKSAFHYTLGKSQRFNPLGNPILIAPTGSVDCACAGGLSIVRVKTKTKM